MYLEDTHFQKYHNNNALLKAIIELVKKKDGDEVQGGCKIPGFSRRKI